MIQHFAKPLGLALAATLSLSACASTGSFSSDFDAQQDFSAYKTFSWAGSNPMTVYGAAPIPAGADTVISQAIQSELEAKGFTYVKDESAADFAIGFTLGTRVEQDVTTTQIPKIYYSNRGNWRWGRPYYPARGIGYSAVGGREVTEVSTYTEGTLAIDIYDTSRKAPVYHGAGKKTLHQSSIRGTSTRPNPLEAQQKIREAVAKILEDFPPS